MRAFLEAGGYSEIIETGDGAAALDLFANGPKRIDLLITDIARPSMDGFALIRAVREIDPDIKVIVVSGQLLLMRMTSGVGSMARATSTFCQNPTRGVFSSPWWTRCFPLKVAMRRIARLPPLGRRVGYRFLAVARGGRSRTGRIIRLPTDWLAGVRETGDRPSVGSFA
jgi:hypothetical protein